MLFESEKRAAALAVSRYGADRAKVQLATQSVHEARARGDAVDLFDLLLEQNLLSPQNVRELRSGLDTTQPDPMSPKNRLPDPPKANGKGESANGTAVYLEESGEELRQLGEYRMVRQLGEGGMGAVFLAIHGGEKRQVAIKILPAHLAGNQVSIDRFYREAKSGALLNHPNIVRNITIGQDKATGKHYLVLEYVDGPSAQALLDRMGKLPVGDAVHIVLDIAKALEHAHSRNVVHRDIKPANILITQSGVAKLTDLGLAKRTDEASHLTAARQGFGTPYYMPYEQAMNARSADSRSDIYALGATFYHLLTGEVPFPGTNHLEIVDRKSLGFFEPASTRNPAVPADLDLILAKMLAKEPRDRYQTASELIVDLDRSNLAAVVPSFTDPEKAMLDPLVRARVTAPAQATSPDLNHQPADEKATPDEMWYLRYRDRQGQWCKAKVSVQQITQRLREGKLSAQAEASQRPQGAFVSLEKLPLFHEAAARARAKKPPRRRKEPRFADESLPAAASSPGDSSAVLATPQRGWLIVCLTMSLAILTAIIVLFVLFRPT
jgi:eukaryotic-like serine/threonine-protein kinase